MKFLVSILVLLLILSKVCHSQQDNYTFLHLSTQNGLSNSWVEDIHQDSKGYLWFATEEGVNRFDGYEFKVFKNIPGDSTSISNGKIEVIYEGIENRLWIGTENGLNLYNRKTGDFKRLQNLFPVNNQDNSHIRGIIEEDSCLWVGVSGAGLLHYSQKKQQRTFYKANDASDNSLSGNMIWSMLKDSKERIWIGTLYNGLNLFDKKTKEFKNYLFGDDKSLLNSILSIHELSENEYLLGTYDGMVHLFINEDGVSYNSYVNDKNDINSISKGSIRAIYKDSYGIIWVATQFGLDIFDIANDRFIHLKSDPSNPYSLKGDEIWSIMEDNSGTLWFGGFNGGGVNILHSNSRFFNSQRLTPKENIVLDIVETENNDFWISIDHGGLFLYNEQEGIIKRYLHTPKNDKSLPTNAVLSVYIDKHNNLWTGSWGGGLVASKNQKNIFEKFIPKAITQESWNIYDILEDRAGNIWTASFLMGVVKYNPNTKEYTIFQHEEGNPNSLSHNVVWKIVEDNEGIIWLGTKRGLQSFNPGNNSFEYYKYKTTTGVELNEYQVSTIIEDSQENIWIGTIGNGINLLNKQDKTFTSITEEDGLINNVIYGILEDNAGNFWISTNKGLSKISFNEKLELTSVFNFDNNNGLEAQQFGKGAYLKSSSGKFYFGSTEGFVSFYPDSIKPNPQIPPVVFTELSIYNEEVKVQENGGKHAVLKAEIDETDTLTFNYEQTVFTIKFSALNFISPQKNMYAYKLEGFDKQWNHVENKREATYTNLDPGTYKFTVKASNNNGIWNDEGRSLTIIVLPPWWETWWFKSAMILFVLSILYAIYLIRVNILKKQKVKLEETVTQRTQTLYESNVRLEESQEELQNVNEQLYEQKEEIKVTLNQLRKTQSQLVESEKKASIGVITAGIAHEINNPLNFIQVGKVVLEEYLDENKAVDQDKVKPLLNMMQEGIRRTSSIVNSLNLVNLEADREKSNCNIHDIIERCLSSGQLPVNLNIKIKKNFTDHKCIVHGLSDDLFQVFTHIIKNAVQAIGSEGEIVIKTNIYNDELIVEITDNGTGIKKEDIKKVTDPFYTTRAPGKGTGLGMSMANSIIQQHKGKLKYVSEYGKGTNVIVSLPLKYLFEDKE